MTRTSKRDRSTPRATRRNIPGALAAGLLMLVTAVSAAGVVPARPAAAALPASGWQAISAGGTHTCAVTNAGGVKCWGRNNNGQIGDGTTTDRPNPVDVSGLASGVAAVRAGGSHTCALTVAGAVLCWGLNNHGQIGTGGAGSVQLTPRTVNTLSTGVVAIATGGEHSCAVTDTGAVRCWGRNDVGQLGVGDTGSRFNPATLAGITGATTIAAAGKLSCALKTGGGVMCWGLNTHGSVGDGTNVDKKVATDVVGLTSGVASIAVGRDHACAVTSAGALECWGLNAQGQLGTGTLASASTPANVSGLASGVTSATAGFAHTCATTASSLLCWGSNSSGQVGNGSLVDRSTPTAVPGVVAAPAVAVAGRTHSCLLTGAGGARCWGSNEYGQLGDGSTVARWGPYLPDPPRSVAATRGDRQATISWMPPSSDGGYPLVSYTVSSSAGHVVTVPSGQTTATLTGLLNGVSYTFTVKATNGVGVGHVSGASNAVTPAGLPGAPGGLSATTGNGRVTVRWLPAAANGAAVSAYTVTASPGGHVAVVPGSATSATVFGLQNGTTYTFTVRAANAVGSGPAASLVVAVPVPKSGYWMLGVDGSVYAFGNSQHFGNAFYPSWPSGTSAVAMKPLENGSGYWIVDSAGGVSAFGSARHLGDRPPLLSGERVSSISTTPTGNGYWLFTNRGRAVAYGDAGFYGDMRNVSLNGPVIGSVATPTGRGYYMVASDGGVFSFGDARFYGSTGSMRLNQPVVGLSPTPTNGGYWLVASDGGVFAFGDAPFRGSMGSTRLNRPVNGLVPFGEGYLMVASDGGVFVFSDQPFFGSLGANPPAAPITGITAFTF